MSLERVPTVWRSILVVVLTGVVLVLVALPASATIHPIVESYDCAHPEAFAHHPLGDPADPPGQTPGVGQHDDQSSLRAVLAVTKDLTDLDSPALFGHKMDGACGRIGLSSE